MVCYFEPIPCKDLLVELRCKDETRICRALSLICSAVTNDEEVVVQLGLAGIHIELHRLLMSMDTEISEAAAQAIEACVNHCPYGVSFPMIARRLDASYANPFILIDLGTDHVPIDAPSQLSSLLVTRDRQSHTLHAVPSGLLKSPEDETIDPDSLASLRFTQSTFPKTKSAQSKACKNLQIRLRKIRELTDSHKKIGNILWVSAIALSRWIVRNDRTAISGKSVLEIGSGLGLCGIVAGRYASSVVLTDFDPVIVRNLEYNVRCNEHLLRAAGRFCSSKVLDWYNLPKEEHKAGAPTGGTNKDGRDTEEHQGLSTGDRFDVVLGSDVVHEERMADGVLAVLKRYLSPSGLAIIVNPHSHHRAGVERFRDLLGSEGFSHQVVGIDGLGVGKIACINARVASESLDCTTDRDEQQGDLRLTAAESIMSHYEEEMRDVRLELHLIRHATR